MNTPAKKPKWPFWVIGIQSILIVFFFLFAYVAKLEADRNMKLAQKNEVKANQQVEIIKKQLLELKGCRGLKNRGIVNSKTE